MAMYEAKEVFDENKVSLGWLVFDGCALLQGPYMTRENAMLEAKRRNDLHDAEVKNTEVHPQEPPPERPRSRGMGGR